MIVESEWWWRRETKRHRALLHAGMTINGCDQCSLRRLQDRNSVLRGHCGIFSVPSDVYKDFWTVNTRIASDKVRASVI
jgi:hypothetical protein